MNDIHVTTYFRLKAGLKLHEEAEKREVEKGIHLLQDPEGMCVGVRMEEMIFVVIFVAVGKKVLEAQRQRQAAERPKAMEVETMD